MTFARLYEFVYGLRGHPIVLEGLVDQEAKKLSSQDELWYVPCELDTKVSLGHIKQYRVSKGVYDHDSSWVTEIRYSEELNFCWKRYVCCKELMHVFDSADEQVNSSERFRSLVNEFEAPLPLDKASPVYLSETKTMWMALAILCPEPVRDKFKDDWNAGALTDYEVALALRIPESLIKSAMGDPFSDMLVSLRPSSA